jgi:glycosyltransferase involved in cell wall biosynthesis
MAKKIAFIKYRSFSHINASVQTQLARVFPECELHVIDVADLFATHRGVLLWNQAHIFKTYGLDILARRRYRSECLFRTRYIFDEIKKMVRKQLPANLNDYLFSFQTQSLFDASVAGLPHFLYTDHTNHANLYYAGYADQKVFPQHWFEVEQSIYRNAVKVFTMSGHVRRSLIEQYGVSEEKPVWVYAGSNAEVSSTVLDNNDYGNKHILFVGVHWERKGGPQLAEAFKLVLKKHPDARLTIIGCSPSLDIPNCDVVGRVPLEKVREYYLRSSIFCLPTRLEPFGIVFVEAMLHKLPIVSTSIGALPDFVVNGRNGYLVPPGDVQQLVERLSDLLDSPAKCHAFGEAGRKVAEDRYSWDAVGNRLKASIMSALKNR